jgi:hypothetical protein
MKLLFCEYLVFLVKVVLLFAGFLSISWCLVGLFAIAMAEKTTTLQITLYFLNYIPTSFVIFLALKYEE